MPRKQKKHMTKIRKNKKIEDSISAKKIKKKI